MRTALSEMVERAAIAMWVDYVHSASPPVEFHKKDDLKHWQVTASESDRCAWRRSARAAIDAMRMMIDEALK